MKAAAFLGILATLITLCPGAHAANPNKFTNTVVPYYCNDTGGNEFAQYVNIPNSHRLAIQATIPDDNGNAGAFYKLNNVPLGTLSFSLTSDRPFFGNIYVETTAGSNYVLPTSFNGTPKYLKGKYLFNGGSGQYTCDLTKSFPAGATVTGVFVFGIYYQSPATLYLDQFAYTNVPITKDTLPSDVLTCN